MELEAPNAAREIFVRFFFQPHVVLDDSDNIVLAGDDGPVGEGEEGIDMVAAEEDSTFEMTVDADGVGVGGDGAYKLVIDEYRCSKPFGSANMSNACSRCEAKRDTPNPP